MRCETDPERSDAVTRSRLLPHGMQLEPPAATPALFSCRYLGAEATGCVYPSGVVCIMPDVLGVLVEWRGVRTYTGPIIFDSLRAAEGSEDVDLIVWEWGVVELLGD